MNPDRIVGHPAQQLKPVRVAISARFDNLQGKKMSNAQNNPTDTLIERARLPRLIVAIISPILVLVIAKAIGQYAFAALILPTWLGALIGLAGGSVAALYIIKRSFIINEAVQAFVTVDPAASLLGKENALVSYGPGTHLCYWWEQRLSGNNVSLVAAAQDISTTIQTANGIVTTQGSVRLRPDVQRLPEFLSGVASAPGELTGLIQEEINAWLGKFPVEVAVQSLRELNDKLKEEFVLAVHPLEVRYGVKIDDVTVNEILPSKQLQETMGALSESATIDLIVAKSFGKNTAKLLQLAVKKGDIASDEVNRRRMQTMAMSGNLQGMDLKSSDFNLNIAGLKDIPPELIGAFGAIAKTMGIYSQIKTPNKGPSK